MPDPKFIQLVTGEYSFLNKTTLHRGKSHVLYGLDNTGKVWKWIPSRNIWCDLHDVNINSDGYFRKPPYNPEDTSFNDELDNYQKKVRISS